jgi:hypothetical protein
MRSRYCPEYGLEEVTGRSLVQLNRHSPSNAHPGPHIYAGREVRQVRTKHYAVIAQQRGSVNLVQALWFILQIA